MSISFIVLFSLTVFIASIIPGPSMLLALTHGMQFGARRTVASALGNLSVTLIQASISIAGLGTILIASETVFLAIRWIGATYLIFVGVSVLFASIKSSTPLIPGETTKSGSPLKMFTQAALVTASNPKAIVFFTAIFPQFINLESGFLAQSIVLLSIGGSIAFICFMLYAVGGQKICTLFSGATFAKYIKRAIGTTFIGVGLGLALTD